MTDNMTREIDGLMIVALDAASPDEQRSADAYKLLLTEGNMTLVQATEALAPVRLPQVGDILSSGWGYEQTRYDFYQVVGVTKASVKIRMISKRYITSTGHGNATVMPVRDSFVTDGIHNSKRGKDGAVLTKRFRMSNKVDYSCKIESYATAYLWDGKPEQESGDY